VHVVLVIIKKEDFTAQMSNMRIWLDNKGIVPTRFDYDHQSDGTIAIRVTFTQGREAAVFAENFGRRR
jgi:hypothetical protein